MSDHLHKDFLPYTADELRLHFVDSGLHFVDSGIEGEDPDSGIEVDDPDPHLKHWLARIAVAPSKDPSYLHRDETLWTAGALMAIQHQAEGDCADRWQAIMAKLFGPVPPTIERMEWSDLLRPDLKLFFEVGLPSPRAYRRWLSKHLVDRQALATQRGVAKSRGEALEGRTHLDALLLSPTSGFALHFEAKVLSTSTRKQHSTACATSSRETSTAWQRPPRSTPTFSKLGIRTAASS